MGRRLRYRTAGQAPQILGLHRNRRPISAARAPVGEIQVIDRSLSVADAAWVDDVPGLRINVEDGTYPVYSYEWAHSHGPITVCVVIPFLRRRWTTTHRLRIANDIRPELKRGLIVDTGEITIASANRITLRSGLGDGYYPVVENRFLGTWTQSIIIDFEIYEPDNYGVGHDLILDEYGIVVGREPSGA